MKLCLFSAHINLMSAKRSQNMIAPEGFYKAASGITSYVPTI